MWRVQRAIIEDAAPGLAALGLHPKAFFLLTEVGRHPYPADLAWSLLLPPPTVSQLVRHVEELGFLIREIDAADRRRFRLRLTPAGSAAVATGRELLAEVLERRLARLTSADQDALNGLLARLEDPAERARGCAGNHGASQIESGSADATEVSA
jgi:DNA-binding MarR family transcriptional regulator